MGWTFTHREKGEYTDLEWWKKEFVRTVDGVPSSDHVIDCATVGLSECYIAYRTKEGKVICVVCMIQRRPKDEYNYGWKDVSEEMGIWNTRCPERILKLLSPVEECFEGEQLKRAKEWRETCWKRINERKSIKLSVGTAFVFKQPVEFGSGYWVKGGIITVLRGSRIQFGTFPGGPSRFRISREQFNRVQGGLYSNLDAWKEAMEAVQETVE